MFGCRRCGTEWSSATEKAINILIQEQRDCVGKYISAGEDRTTEQKPDKHPVTVHSARRQGVFCSKILIISIYKRGDLV